MKFSLDGGYKSEKTKTTTSRDATTMPIVPDWIEGPTADAFGRVHELGAQDPSSFVAGADPLQQTARANAGALGDRSNWDAAAEMTRSALVGGPASYSAESLLTGLDNYKNPYLRDVAQTSLADYDFGANKTRAQQDLNLAGAFGGSGDAITRSLTEGELARGRGSLAAGLYSDAFNTAANFSNMDAQRRQQANADNAASANNFTSQKLAAAAQLGSLASNYDAGVRDTSRLQADVGTLFRGIDQEQVRAPLDLVQWQNQQYASLPASLFTGQHQTSLETTKSKTSGFSLSGGVSGPFG